jgi:hypothetical protein
MLKLVGSKTFKHSSTDVKQCVMVESHNFQAVDWGAAFKISESTGIQPKNT